MFCIATNQISLMIGVAIGYSYIATIDYVAAMTEGAGRLLATGGEGNLAFIRFFDSPDNDISEVGGKAKNLSEMYSEGFPVPPGFVVTVTAYEEFISANGIRKRIGDLLDSTKFDLESDVQTCSRRIKDLILEGEMSPSLGGSIERALEEMGGEFWAVRSSAAAEDLPDASFAGQQDSYLCVPTDAVAHHLIQCWASYWNGRALKYRHDAGIDQLEGGIAVVIQSMVASDSSGIMFTIDPLRPKDGNMIIESSWGLGEAIVSGLVSPDRFVVDREGQTILSREMNKKNKAIFLVKEGRSLVDVEEWRRLDPSITDMEVGRLAEVGRRIEKFFGSPQDVEWSTSEGEIFILQSRPITTLDEDDQTLWTRAYGDEYWADVTSPLFFSLLGEYLTKIVNHEGSKVMGYNELTDKRLLRIHKGHIYFNSEVLESVFTYNPKFSRTKELLNYFPEKDQERIANAKTKVAKRLWAEVRIAIIDPDGMILRTDKAYRKWAEKFIERAKRFDALDLDKMRDEDLYFEFKDLESGYIKHYRLIRYGMVTHSIGTNLMVKRWLTDWLDDRSGTLYSKLISGLPDNRTIKTNIAIARLASIARENPLVLEQIVSRNSHQFLEVLRTDPSLHPFKEEFDRFLEDYGHRSHTREVYFPRWGDDPTLVVEVLKALVQSPVLDLDEVERRKQEERVTAEKEIMERISKLKMGFLRKSVFKIVLKNAQIYLQFRENQRFYLDHIIYRWRHLFMEYGRRYLEKGIIDDPNDIFFLSKEEIFDIARGAEPPSRMEIRRRRADFERYKEILPPKFLKGRVEFDDTQVMDGDCLKVTGTSASPGVAEGRARVVDSIERLSEVMEGEILITSNTDPGWTAVFSKLGGLITETGGILSHGAVVSREYGIPAVTAVKNATRIFRTGQELLLDGNDGIVYVRGE
jgi:phosphohistidine swiveling domain-containing protein